ncbi:hypothetical protein [Streptomyces sp. NPDC005283]|uniref:hypothetical protein n=1 Tax=Streptomyces sp. NPDC005283 TaxID=3156871 RepID=UPI00345169CA
MGSRETRPTLTCPQASGEVGLLFYEAGALSTQLIELTMSRPPEAVVDAHRAFGMLATGMDTLPPRSAP